MNIFQALLLRNEINKLTESGTAHVDVYSSDYSVRGWTMVATGANICAEYNVYNAGSVYATVDNGGLLRSVCTGSTTAKNASAKILLNALRKHCYTRSK